MQTSEKLQNFVVLLFPPTSHRAGKAAVGGGLLEECKKLHMNIHMATLPRVIQIQIAQPRFSEMNSPAGKVLAKRRQPNESPGLWPMLHL